MKKLSAYLFPLVLVLFFANGCATSTGVARDDTGTEPTEQRDPGTRTMSNPTSLADILIRIPGVFVDERGLGTRVSVRGGAPLYVVDGVRLGHSYQSAAMAVNVNDIAEVEVLKSPTETMQYGRAGANGVILIRTRRGA